jgi:hypothetical protein
MNSWRPCSLTRFAGYRAFAPCRDKFLPPVRWPSESDPSPRFASEGWGWSPSPLAGHFDLRSLQRRVGPVRRTGLNPPLPRLTRGNLKSPPDVSAGRLFSCWGGRASAGVPSIRPLLLGRRPAAVLRRVGTAEGGSWRGVAIVRPASKIDPSAPRPRTFQSSRGHFTLP